MELRVLIDNNTYIDRYYFGEPALSFLIKDGDTTVLFDTGYSGIFTENAELMGEDLSKVDCVVLSHGHNDHTGGLKELLNQQTKLHIIAHPETFARRYDDNGLFIGSPLSAEEIETSAQVTYTKDVLQLSEHLYYLGEIPTLLPFEKRIPIGKISRDGRLYSDEIRDDSALIYVNENGIFMISGCAHSGICSIIEYAKKVSGKNKVLGVIGGFHLFEDDARTKETIAYLKNEQIKDIYPCHCVSLKVKTKMAEAFEIHEVGVGMSVTVSEEGCETHE